MMNVLSRRSDGSFVATVNGMPYHVALDDPMFAEADPADIAAAPLDQPIAITPPPPSQVTKLQIRDEAVANYPGMWPAVKAFIDADPDRKERWDLATVILTTDSLVGDMQDELGWTNEQRDTFLADAAQR